MMYFVMAQMHWNSLGQLCHHKSALRPENLMVGDSDPCLLLFALTYINIVAGDYRRTKVWL